jgi:hypothetical protein
LLSRHIELPLCLALLGNVAGDLGKADKPACGIANRIDDDVGPEAFTALANSPALGLILALHFRGAKCARRQINLAILIGIEHGEVLPDHLLLRITFDARRSGVPICDPAVRIEHVDRVVGDTLNKQLEALLAFAPGLRNEPLFQLLASSARRNQLLVHSIELADRQAFRWDKRSPSESISMGGKSTDRSGESDTDQICDNDGQDGKDRAKRSKRPKDVSQRALDNPLWNSDRDLPSIELRAGKPAAHQLALGIQSLPNTLILTLVLDESFPPVARQIGRIVGYAP